MPSNRDAHRGACPAEWSCPNFSDAISFGTSISDGRIQHLAAAGDDDVVHDDVGAVQRDRVDRLFDVDVDRLLPAEFLGRRDRA